MCTFEYLPLKEGQFTGKLTFHSSELGVYQYNLQLTATAPVLERPINFTVALGGNQQAYYSFTSYAKGKTEYSLKVRIDGTRPRKSLWNFLYH